MHPRASRSRQSSLLTNKERMPDFLCDSIDSAARGVFFVLAFILSTSEWHKKKYKSNTKKAGYQSNTKKNAKQDCKLCLQRFLGWAWLLFDFSITRCNLSVGRVFINCALSHHSAHLVLADGLRPWNCSPRRLSGFISWVSARVLLCYVSPVRRNCDSAY